MYKVPSRWKEKDDEFLKRLGSTFSRIPLVPTRGWIDDQPLHYYMGQMIVSKGFHMFQTEVRSGVWNIVVFKEESSKQALIVQNRKWESVERMLYELALFNKLWIEPNSDSSKFTAISDTIFIACRDKGYRYSKNTFMCMALLRNNISDIISFGAQLILGTKLDGLKYEGVRV